MKKESSLLIWAERFGLVVLALAGTQLLFNVKMEIDEKLDRTANLEQAVENVKAQSEAPHTSEFFFVTRADLKKWQGQWVVYSDGSILQPFTGSFRVCLRNLETGRHYWTCQWTDWIPYDGNPGVLRYHQPEKLDWWANIPLSIVQEISDKNPKLMETCWRAKVEEIVLEPVCVTSIWRPVS